MVFVKTELSNVFVKAMEQFGKETTVTNVSRKIYSKICY